jgi:cellulose synthase/poly-beta-1,6-N-acetylglucosamine synthase-like glycosyltransferase
MIPFSLVTTCRNEMRSFPRWKENILAQTRPPDEIVIVDAFSDDGTAEAITAGAKCDPRVKLIQEKGAAAHGRNVAIEAATYEHVLSTDMGVRLATVWCEELITPFEKDPTVQIVAGNTCIDPETVRSAVARAEYYMENGGEPNLGPGFVPGNRSVAYTQTVWRELGGLPEDLTFYADDSVFGRQMIEAGYKMAYAPRAMTYWGRPQRLGQFVKEWQNYGRGDGEALIKMPRAVRWHCAGRIPAWLVAPITALRGLSQQFNCGAIRRSLRQADVTAFLLMPVLAFRRSYAYASAYLVGMAHGETHCQSARKRLQDAR